SDPADPKSVAVDQAFITDIQVSSSARRHILDFDPETFRLKVTATLLFNDREYSGVDISQSVGTLRFGSSDASIVSVSENGLFRPIAAGTAELEVMFDPLEIRRIVALEVLTLEALEPGPLAAAIDVNGDQACVITDQGLRCWGRYAQEVPQDLINPTAVAVGGNHACAITDEGVRCWGDNYSGQTDVPEDLG